MLPPKDITDPVELATWALQQAASRMQASDGQYAGAAPPNQDQRASVSNGQSFPVRTVLFGWEHPEDPAEYMPLHVAPKYGWPSWWRFPEWDAFARAYDVHMARLDQGKLGHARPKPTVFATTSWFLFESLHNQVLTSEERSLFTKGPESLAERLQQSGLGRVGTRFG